MANISFAERIRRTRIRSALNQGEVAAKVGVSAPTVSNWETGKTAPNKDQKDQFKRVFGLSARAATSVDITRQPEAGPSPFAAWLTRARLDRKLSVAELAAASGLSVGAIYTIESGRILNPRPDTLRRLERALRTQIAPEIRQEIHEEATIEGIGELIDFDPHDLANFPAIGGIYVLYDVSSRPIYVGQGADIKKRLIAHRQKFWYKEPIIQNGAYLKIDDTNLRQQVEKLLIRFLKATAVLNVQNVDRGES